MSVSSHLSVIKQPAIVEDTQAIKETMNGLATKAFALYAAEKAGQVANEKKKEVCPKCGE